MCGDVDEQDGEAGRLYAAFLERAQSAIYAAADRRGGSRSRLDGQPGPLADAALHGYMDGLFADILKACITDGQRVDEGSRYRVLAAQAVVLARLAGLLSGHLDVREDPLRAAISALMDGYGAEGERG